MLVYKNTWLTLGWVMIALVFYLSLTPSPPEIDIGFKYIDKIEHFIAYVILMGWFCQIYKTTKTRIFYFVFFIAMGVLIEVLQGLGTVRYFEYSDMLANSLGVAVAWFITKARYNSLLLSLEKMMKN